MNTDRDTRDRRYRSRTLRATSLLASLSMAMIGLVGIGLAAPASADTAPACPADTTTTTWELQGDVCVGTTTEAAAPEQGASTWSCPAGFTTGDNPITESSTCTRPVEPEESYYCTDGYVEGPGFPADDSCVTYREVPTYAYQDASVTGYTCKAGKTYRTEPSGPGCYQWTLRWNSDRHEWEWTWQITGIDPTPVYSCPDGWSEYDDDQCRMQTGTEQVIDRTRDPRSSWTCPTPGPAANTYRHHDQEEPLTCPDESTPAAETTHWFCPEGYTPEGQVAADASCTRISVERQTATCPVDGDVLTNLGDEEVANWQCVTPLVPVPPAGGGGPAVFTASATASGGQEICLADGVTTVAITYSVTGTGSGPTTGDAQFSANVATVDAVNAAIAAQTPEGATLGACGAPITEVPVVVNPVLPATVPEEPEAVSVPQAATVPTAVPAGDGSEDVGTPVWAVALAIAGMLGAASAGVGLVKSQR